VKYGVGIFCHLVIVTTAASRCEVVSATERQPMAQSGAGRIAKWDHALLGAFAPHRDGSTAKIEIVEVHTAELGHSKARAVQQFQYGVVARAARAVVVALRWLVQQDGQFIGFENAGQPTRSF
jgi:hypothetical protein